MIVLGWLSLALVGCYFAVTGTLTLSLIFLRGGLETLGTALFLAAVAGVTWLGVIAWISPLARLGRSK